MQLIINTAVINSIYLFTFAYCKGKLRVINLKRQVSIMANTMQAIVTTTNAKQPLTLSEVPMPTLAANDILVRLNAASVNPVDQKQRQGAVANATPKILGFDGAGEVTAVGVDVTKFKIGDKVFYAGELGRTGSNAQFQAVREELAAFVPESISLTKAAAVPLTFLTAYEILIDKFHLTPVANSASGKTILIINGAGGVGSAMIQLAKWLGLTVIASSSRPETIKWVQDLGADYTVNHYADYPAEIKDLGFDTVPYVAVLNSIDTHLARAAQIVSPFGHIGMIVEPSAELPIGGLLKSKAVSLDWEFMFAKAANNFDVASQGTALALAAKLIDTGHYQSPLTVTNYGMTVETIFASQEIVGAGKVMGKLVIEY